MIATRKLEANVVRHCNNRCASCNHASPFANPYVMSESILERDLEMLGRILHTEFFCLQGGEPLLHPNLVGMMDVALKSGIAERYGILTNGKLIPRMPDDFWEKANELNLELRLTVYENLPADVLPYAVSKSKHYSRINLIPGPVETFTKVLGNFPNGESFYTCRWKICHTVHEGHFYICPLSAFWPERFMGIKEPVDGYELATATESGLQAFINRVKPLTSCQRCTGEAAPSIHWHECSTEEQWMKDSTI